MDLRKERTLKLLSEGLITLLLEKPYANITVSEICQEAMVRRATFYRHFGGKDDLLAYTVAKQRAHLDLQVDPDDTLPLPNYCHDMTSGFLRLAYAHRSTIAARALLPEFAFVESLMAKELAKRFAQKLAQRMGTDRPSERQNDIASFYAHGLVGAVCQHVVSGEAEAADNEAFLASIDDIAQRLFGWMDNGDVASCPDSMPSGQDATSPLSVTRRQE